MRMTDDEHQHGIQGRLRPGRQARPRRAGEPNVLSSAAVPNQLSSQASQPKGGSTVTRPGEHPEPAPVPAAPVRPVPARAGAEGEAPPEGRRLPATPTLIFLAFVALTAFRLLGEFLEGAGPVQTPGPGATAVAPGTVRFGTDLDDDCGIADPSDAFESGADVWWSAELSTRRDATETVVVIVRRDGAEIEREVVPPDGTNTAWSVLCSGEPVAEQAGGTYRVEVWNEGITVLLAAGEYVVASGSG